MQHTSPPENKPRFCTPPSCDKQKKAAHQGRQKRGGMPPGPMCTGAHGSWIAGAPRPVNGTPSVPLNAEPLKRAATAGSPLPCQPPSPFPPGMTIASAVLPGQGIDLILLVTPSSGEQEKAAPPGAAKGGLVPGAAAHPGMHPGPTEIPVPRKLAAAPLPASAPGVQRRGSSGCSRATL